MKKPISTYIIIGISFLLLTLVFISCKKSLEKELTKKSIKHEESLDDNPFKNLRNMAINVTAEQLGLNEIRENEIYGIVSEIDFDGATATVISYKTGEASIYLSSGGGFIGAGHHENVQKAVKNYIKLSQKYLERAKKIDSVELPKRGMTQFNFLTKNGIYCISKKTPKHVNEKSEFSILFEELDKVMTVIRLKTGN